MDRFGVGLARRSFDVAIVFDQKCADESPAKIRERESLRLEVAVRLACSDDEIDERLIGTATIDRERRDARADDDRKSEEALADDFAERLKAADALADALEPTVGADRVERKFLASVGGHE